MDYPVTASAGIPKHIGLKVEILKKWPTVVAKRCAWTNV
jgi:hypothetical protein